MFTLIIVVATMSVTLIAVALLFYALTGVPKSEPEEEGDHLTPFESGCGAEDVGGGDGE